jgi:hypothetical protein
MHIRAHPHARILPLQSSWKASRTLVVRGGAARTFGSLVAFIAALLVACGLYLLGDAFAHPITAHDTGVLGAALTIALGSVLFFYLLRPGRTRHAGRGVPRRAVDGLVAHNSLLVSNGNGYDGTLHNGNGHGSVIPDRNGNGRESTALANHRNSRLASATPEESPENTVPQESAGDALRGRR